MQLVALGVIAAALAGHAVLGPLPERPVLGTALLLVASGAWLVALVRGRAGEGGLRRVVLGAVLLQVVGAVGGPALSDDVYRYAWEGEVLARGISPYAHAPDSPDLDAVRQALPELAALVGHPGISAAYPPAAILFYAAVAGTTHRLVEPPQLAGVRALRAALALCDLLVLIPLVALLRRRGLPDGAAVAWAWSPLVALEFSGSGHLESLGILLTLSALWLATGRRSGSRREFLTGAVLGVAVLVKWVPAAAVPFVLLHRAWRPRLLGLCAAAVALHLPLLFLEGGITGLFAGLGQYGRRWEGGSLVFRWVDEAVRAGHLGQTTDPQMLGRRLMGLLWLACLGFALLRRRSDPVRATGIVLGAFVVLSPILHPWYLAWPLAFAVFGSGWAWPTLVALAPLLYWPLAGWLARGEWVEPAWVWWSMAPAFALMALVDVLRRERK